MSGWGGAIEDSHNEEAERRLTAAYALDDSQRSAVGQILHTMTYHRSYRTSEVEELLVRLLDRRR